MKKNKQQRKINSLHDLRMEQARVQRAYERMEDNWNKIIAPTKSVTSSITPLLLTAVSDKIKNPLLQTAFDVGASALQKSIAEKKIEVPSVKKITDKLLSSKKKVAKNNKSKSDKSYKKLGRSLLRWQIASLVLFVGFNILVNRRKKRRDTH